MHAIAPVSLRKVLAVLALLVGTALLAGPHLAQATSRPLYFDANGTPWCGEGSCSGACCSGDRVPR